MNQQRKSRPGKCFFENRSTSLRCDKSTRCWEVYSVLNKGTRHMLLCTVFDAKHYKCTLPPRSYRWRCSSNVVNAVTYWRIEGWWSSHCKSASRSRRFNSLICIIEQHGVIDRVKCVMRKPEQQPGIASSIATCTWYTSMLTWIYE